MDRLESLNKLLEHSFRENWEREALSNYQGVTYRYKDVAEKVACIHLNFRRHGLEKGDKVAICGRNQVNWGVSFLAALTYGAIPVPILHEFKPGNIHYLVNHSEARVLFVDEAIWENLSESEMLGLSVVVQLSDFQCLYSGIEEVDVFKSDFSGLLAGSYPDGFKPSDVVFPEENPDDLALINYTSGTSGFSKGVMLPYRSLLENVFFAHYTAEPQMDNTSRMVSILPSAHMYGMLFEFLFEMCIGAHVFFLTRVPSPKIIMKAFSEIHPDMIISVPLIIEKVYKSNIKPLVDKNKTYLKIPLINQMVLKKMKDALVDAFGAGFEEVILGGAAFNPEVEKFFREMHFPFTVGYGMTECGPIITYEKWSNTRLGSCGKAVPGCSIRVDSPDPANIPGEIQVKGPNVFIGYYKNEDATRAAFTSDGWFKTGDMGVIDQDGYLYLKGRSKCMILGPSGQNIYPEELEGVLNNVRYIVDSLVIEDKGDIVALVYLDYHAGELEGLSGAQLEERIVSSLPEINQEIPNYARIKRIEFMPEDFERTPKRSIKRYLYQRS